MLRKPEEGEAAISKICGSTSWEEVCPEHIQPMPHLRFNLAHGYLANQNWIKALRHIVPVCLVSDPILFSSRSHPIPVSRLYMMIYILLHVIEQEDRDGPETPTHVAGLQLSIIHKQCLLCLMENVSRSHGDDSTLGKAARYSCAEQTALLNKTAKAFGEQQKTSLVSWMTGPLLEVAQVEQRKLLIWAGIR